MDRTTTNIAQSQTGFINFIIMPSFGHLETFLPKTKVFMDQIGKNKNNWDTKIPNYAEKMEEQKRQVEKNNRRISNTSDIAL